jgi:hypothetical protein
MAQQDLPMMVSSKPSFNNNNVVLLIGPPASGKTRWIRDNVPGCFFVGSHCHSYALRGQNQQEFVKMPIGVVVGRESDVCDVCFDDLGDSCTVPFDILMRFVEDTLHGSGVMVFNQSIGSPCLVYPRTVYITTCLQPSSWFGGGDGAGGQKQKKVSLEQLFGLIMKFTVVYDHSTPRAHETVIMPDAFFLETCLGYQNKL